ncbi:hypothetical protein WOLCODRAFT_160094 [Wolfiporia cocos MD-104 SS10]|uniref:Glutamine amidotransferase type-2 domain-containing protein n=1 Tax=Wolfiporia cocos (strain MD-104) TaxID=742152 RepID=A0A2H3IU13_WOLCO|nr:hypothetical protein WOLCODRAFT_160094 [Wolfiporia cocos MD-104 SS10]
MCGILFAIQNGPQPVRAELLQQLQAANTSRGPDAQDSVGTSVDNYQLSFFVSELRLRGNIHVSQPHRDQEGNILCWNGEVFEGLSITLEENDGSELFASLREQSTIEGVRDCLGSIEGPYVFVYYQRALQRLYFARDPLGRRSLLIHRPTTASPNFLATSVSIGPHVDYDLEELLTDGICCIDIGQLSKAQNARIHEINRAITDDPPKVHDLDHIENHLSSAVDDLIAHLDRSVMLRVQNIPPSIEGAGQARVAVLFSGGIDSTMLAFLANSHVDPSEPIDLLNVAFENPRKITVKVEGNVGGLPNREKKLKLRNPLDYSTVNVSYDVPDRLTGLQEVEELRRLCPGRKWNFVEINVPFEESQCARQTIEAIMYPRRTVMDLSLALPLYFAARGIGQIRSQPEAKLEPYTTPARVLLNGLGSDELLGGYGRFRTTYKNAGWIGIIDELQLELNRIPTRNLGRDDRIISSHGKEARHPFLSLSVVGFLARLPVHMKMDPRLDAGLGEKMLLRLAARRVGLIEASSRKKRAMQFGSHSARMMPGEGDRKGDFLID